MMNPSSDMDLLYDDAYLHVLREQMYKFAILQLGDYSLAEDAVQEALLGALKNSGSFNGRAALKTWVFTILKNKIADLLRCKEREPISSTTVHDCGGVDDFSVYFNDKGYWHKHQRPHVWQEPEASLNQVQFWRIFEACLDVLPHDQARVFMMREFVGFDTGEICATAKISSSNLYVLLHRARLKLIRCMEDEWFCEEHVHAEL